MIEKKTLKEIRKKLNNTTEGYWEYDAKRDEYDFCIYAISPIESEYREGTISEESGVVGSSEWTYICDEDAEFIASSKEYIELLLNEVMPRLEGL